MSKQLKAISVVDELQKRAIQQHNSDIVQNPALSNYDMNNILELLKGIKALHFIGPSPTNYKIILNRDQIIYYENNTPNTAQKRFSHHSKDSTLLPILIQLRRDLEGNSCQVLEEAH